MEALCESEAEKSAELVRLCVKVAVRAGVSRGVSVTVALKEKLRVFRRLEAVSVLWVAVGDSDIVELSVSLLDRSLVRLCDKDSERDRDSV